MQTRYGTCTTCIPSLMSVNVNSYFWVLSSHSGVFTCSYKCVNTWKCRHGVSVDQAWYMDHMYCQFKVIKCKFLFLVLSSHSGVLTCSHNVNMW